MGLFSIFTRIKEEDLENAKKESINFWNWFIDNETLIISNLSDQTTSTDMLNTIDNKLMKIFPKFKGNLHFGFDVSKHIFDMVHFDNRYLFKMMTILKNEMPEELENRWEFNLIE